MEQRGGVGQCAFCAVALPPWNRYGKSQQHKASQSRLAAELVSPRWLCCQDRWRWQYGGGAAARGQEFHIVCRRRWGGSFPHWRGGRRPVGRLLPRQKLPIWERRALLSVDTFRGRLRHDWPARRGCSVCRPAQVRQLCLNRRLWLGLVGLGIAMRFAHGWQCSLLWR